MSSDEAWCFVISGFSVFVCTFQGSRNITSQVKKPKLGEIKWWKHFALPPIAAISGDKHASTRRQLLSDNGQRVISPVGGFASDLQSSIGMVFTQNSQHLIPLKAGSVSETSFTPYLVFLINVSRNTFRLDFTLLTAAEKKYLRANNKDDKIFLKSFRFLNLSSEIKSNIPSSFCE